MPVIWREGTLSLLSGLLGLLFLCGTYQPFSFVFRYTTEYFDQPKRGYGQNVVDVFHALKKNNFEDPFGPAKDQFQGSGSYGNGGSMRVAPVALFYHKNETEMVDVSCCDN